MYYKSISSESDFKLAKLALEQKLNMEDIEEIDIGINIMPKEVTEDITKCISLAMQYKPDLKMSEFILKSSEYGSKIAQSKEMPRVDLSGHYKEADEVYVKDFRAELPHRESKLDPHKKWYAGVEVNWPFLGSTGTYSLYKKVDPPTISTYYGGAESKGTTWKFGVLDNMKQFTEAQEAEVAYARARQELDETRKKSGYGSERGVLRL